MYPSCGQAADWHARVNTRDQNEKRQLDGLVPDRVFTDKASGRSRCGRNWPKCCGLPVAGTPSWCIAWTGSQNLDDLRALVQCLTRKRGAGGVRQRTPALHRGGLAHAQPHARRHGAFAVFELSLIR